MNIQDVLVGYDSMFGNHSLEEIETYLKEKMREAALEQDAFSLITLLNEVIGFTRDTGQKEKSLEYCKQLKEILHKVLPEGSLEYGTSLLNIANAYRAFGLQEESLKLHEKVEEIYKKYLDSEDFSFASLYNNWSLLYQEMSDFESAKEKLLLALKIVDLYEDKVIPQATTRVNLANTLLKLKNEKDYETAMLYLKEALVVFEKEGGKDFHYSAALAAMGDALCHQKAYGKAAEYYANSMSELEKHVGKTPHYQRIREKYEAAKELASGKGMINQNLARCRKFYETYGREMIEKKFSGYEDKIAVGMVGEGSDCYGYDDEISTDHDYGLGFCLWLTKEDAQKIGDELQTAYEELLQQYALEHPEEFFKSGQIEESRLASRRGVFTINDFYKRILGEEIDYENGECIDNLKVSENRLAEAVNGEVFFDALGCFSMVRKMLQNYYPKKIWRVRLSKKLHEFSQYAQANYPRMMARKDYVTAELCKAKAMESAMDIWYLLNKIYAPYYKWRRAGLENLSGGQKMAVLLDALPRTELQNNAWENISYRADRINREDKCVEIFEQIAEMILEELKRQELTEGKDCFLESYCEEIRKGKNMDLVEKIVALEWKQFDRVKNEGGRASCQDDWGTFSIMRKSQYLTWNRELLESFYRDLVEAESSGWNLITEKYARMMESTSPEKYGELEKNLPKRSPERIKIQEEIIHIQVKWMEEFASAYPKMAGNARSIYSSEDNAYNTSYETYLRGEIGTYSENTFLLYGRFIVELFHKGKNLAYETMNHTAKLYGYASLEDAESRIQGLSNKI